MCTQVSKLHKINNFFIFFKGILKWSLLILKLLIMVVNVTMTMGPIQFQWLEYVMRHPKFHNIHCGFGTLSSNVNTVKMANNILALWWKQVWPCEPLQSVWDPGVLRWYSENHWSAGLISVFLSHYVSIFTKGEKTHWCYFYTEDLPLLWGQNPESVSACDHAPTNWTTRPGLNILSFNSIEANNLLRESQS